MSENDQNWMLSRADADALHTLRDKLWALRRTAHSGEDLLAVAAVVATVEAILEREEFRSGVRLSWTDRPDMMDGMSVSIEVSDEGINLSIMEFVSTGQGRSCDHGTTFSVHLDEDGSFDRDGVSHWIKSAEAHSSGQPGLRTEIAWLPDY